VSKLVTGPVCHVQLARLAPPLPGSTALCVLQSANQDGTFFDPPHIIKNDSNDGRESVKGQAAGGPAAEA
jgi:hypothetical protein